MYPRSLFCANIRKYIIFFSTKNMIFTALKIAAYCILLKTCLHSFVGVSEIDPRVRPIPHEGFVMKMVLQPLFLFSIGHEEIFLKGIK